MRRADRLFQILLLLGRGKVWTAQRLAVTLEISERTVYRDIQDLMRCGVPIDGEAGVGYLLRRGYQVPPLMFTRDELEALALGASIVQSWADKALGDAADKALAKIEAVVPGDLKNSDAKRKLFVPDFHVPAVVTERLGILRRAIGEQRRVQLSYRRADGEASQRTVHPLGLFYWGAAWTLGAWCELRAAFRGFRLDRIEHQQLLPGHFSAAPGKTLADYLRHVCNETDNIHSQQTGGNS